MIKLTSSKNSAVLFNVIEGLINDIEISKVRID